MDKHIKKFYDFYQGKSIDDAGSYTSAEFSMFASNFRRQIRRSAKERGISLAAYYTGHYDVSGFFEKDGRFVYFSYSIPRLGQPIDFEQQGIRGILYRTATDIKDFYGGQNHFINLPCFMDRVENLINI